MEAMGGTLLRCGAEAHASALWRQQLQKDCRNDPGRQPGRGAAGSPQLPALSLVPETGLEPALPMREPGPQPGASAGVWQGGHAGVALQDPVTKPLAKNKIAQPVVP